MSKTFLGLAILIFACFGSCKKNDSGSTTAPPVDSTKIFVRGFVPSTLAELNALGFVEDLDSAKIPAQNFWVPAEYIIPDMPAIGNQRGFNACAPYAVVHGMLSRLYRPMEAGFTAAPFYVWNKINLFQNKGTTLTEVMEVLNEHGAPSNRIYTNDNDLFYFARQVQDEDAARHTIAEYHPFKTIDRDRIKGFLFKNYPLPFGVDVDYDFIYNSKEIPKTKGRIVWKSRGAKDLGGHAMLLIGYSDSLHAYKVQNSWNPDIWGEQGYIWIDYDFFEQAVVKVSGIPQIFWATPMGVTTNYADSIKATTASVAGHVQTENGQTIVQRGICWSNISQKPRIDDQRVVSGSGIGNFKGYLTGLKPNTKYWVRAFATKASGLTIYGVVDSLITTNVNVAENNLLVYGAVGFTNNVTKNFTLRNLDGSEAIPLNYSLVTVGNNDNSNITITKTNTTNNFSLKLSTSATGVQATSFDILYDSKFVQKLYVSDLSDSTEFYKNLVLGEWLNTWDYLFPATNSYSFYEEDKIICYSGGTATWVEARYYTGVITPMNTTLNWRVTRQGEDYYFSLGAQSGRITPTSMSFFSQPFSNYRLITHKN